MQFLHYLQRFRIPTCQEWKCRSPMGQSELQGTASLLKISLKGYPDFWWRYTMADPWWQEIGMRGRDTAVATCSRQIRQKHAKAAKSKDSKPVLKRCYHIVSMFLTSCYYSHRVSEISSEPIRKPSAPGGSADQTATSVLRMDFTFSLAANLSHCRHMYITPHWDVRLPGLQSGCRLGGHHCKIHRPLAAETRKYEMVFNDSHDLFSISENLWDIFSLVCSENLLSMLQTLCPFAQLPHHFLEVSCESLHSNPDTAYRFSLGRPWSFEGFRRTFSIFRLAASVRRERLDCRFSMEDQTIFDIFHNSLHGRVGPVAPRIQQLGRSQFRGLQTPLRAIGSRGSEVRNWRFLSSFKQTAKFTMKAFTWRWIEVYLCVCALFCRPKYQLEELFPLVK